MPLHIPRRIENGIAKGELTHGELGMLKNDRQGIRQTRQAAREDGQISEEEKEAIRTQVRSMSQDVYALKHNDEKRGC